MKVLIAGNGGREHALLWKLHRDAPSARFFITRGNGGTAAFATHLPLDPGDIGGIARWADAEGVDLVVVGPEAPLAEGLVDALQQRRVPAFGPSADAAALEASKAFSKGVMRAAGVPTADYRVFTDPVAATAFIRERGAPLVVKASGLAAGKGALVCDREEDALQAVESMLRRHDFGEAGQEVVIEEFMRGEELSVFAIADGRDVLPMTPAQDHKRVGAGDTGPNTGGMGAYAPVSLAGPELLEEVRERILLPTLDEMRRRKRPFRGLLYAGLMLTEEGPKVVEFNCRFGDPETQAVLPLLDSSLLEPMLAIARGGSTRDLGLAWRPGAAVTTVLASGGYPGPYEKGREIRIPPDLEREEDVLVFHAGTARSDGRLVTAGGRVLAVTGLGGDVAAAARHSRDAAGRIDFEGRHFRPDIGWRELERARAS
ncbi:MAG TPA: phosphoribosylamine--glycine ligase [Longimicrobiales bacterium]|nr:phosphoribosylamine--glycine ligase [Longimicrobiales bacterium]